MNNIKFLKKLLALVLCFTLLTCSFALAAPPVPTDGSPEDTSEPSSSTTTGDLGSTVSDEISKFNTGEGAYATIKQIASIMLWIAIVICVFKVIQIGIKLLTSGTGKGKQEAKSSLIPFLIGAVVCFMFVTIGSTIIDILVSGVSGGVFDI